MSAQLDEAVKVLARTMHPEWYKPEHRMSTDELIVAHEQRDYLESALRAFADAVREEVLREARPCE